MLRGLTVLCPLPQWPVPFFRKTLHIPEFSLLNALRRTSRWMVHLLVGLSFPSLCPWIHLHFLVVFSAIKKCYALFSVFHPFSLGCWIIVHYLLFLVISQLCKCSVWLDQFISYNIILLVVNIKKTQCFWKVSIIGPKSPPIRFFLLDSSSIWLPATKVTKLCWNIYNRRWCSSISIKINPRRLTGNDFLFLFDFFCL